MPDRRIVVPFSTGFAVSCGENGLGMYLLTKIEAAFYNKRRELGAFGSVVPLINSATR